MVPAAAAAVFPRLWLAPAVLAQPVVVLVLWRALLLPVPLQMLDPNQTCMGAGACSESCWWSLRPELHLLPPPQQVQPANLLGTMPAAQLRLPCAVHPSRIPLHCGTIGPPSLALCCLHVLWMLLASAGLRLLRELRMLGAVVASAGLHLLPELRMLE